MAVTAMSIRITGQVQGVGFRPFVYNLADRLSVCGFVRNDSQDVFIHAQAESQVLQRFKERLLHEQPSMSLIEGLKAELIDVESEYTNFTIAASEVGEMHQGVTPDASVCQACLAELFDPKDRRYKYPFINCTNCGPRYSLITALPYDRAHTTMRAFTQCQLCSNEYNASSNRRFHAQPNACAECGPSLSFHNHAGEQKPSCDPIAETLALIQQGGVMAVKGIGGFHLVCDARNDEAIKRLRELKHREAKPFAVMAANPDSLSSVVQVTQQAKQRLQSMDAPIVLCPRVPAEQGEDLPDSIAPGLAWLGVMLPHSPLHYLLFHKAAGEPAGSLWLDEPQDLLLVMTSANRSGNPLVFENPQAFKQLAGIADGFLVHDRDIYTRNDDSVISAMGSEQSVVRRGRGLSPQFIPLSSSFEQLNKSVLSVGAFYKNTVCLTKGNRAYVSQYIGDLDNPDCCRALNETVEQLKSLLDIEPELVVSDQHPDFYSSQFAERYSQQQGIPWLQVQHHHAHISAVVAEHQIREPVLGLALDGLGLGDNGELWGGELLFVHEGQFERIAHLSPLVMPGAEQASKAPWRMAAGALFKLGQADCISQRFSEQSGVNVVEQLLLKQLNCPETTSAGRLFDTVAGLLGVSNLNQYEGQAAMLLESLAYNYLQDHDWPTELPIIEIDGEGNLNCLLLLDRLSNCSDPAYGAALFHQQFIQGLVQWVGQYSVARGIKRVALSGGCFLNKLLLSGVKSRLQKEKLDVFLAVKMPCNDGAISLGQAQIALEIEYQNFLQKQQTGSALQHDQCNAFSEEKKLCV